MPALLGLSACETTSASPPPAKVASRPQKQDFLTLGRDLSKGTVDLYRPGTDFLPDTATGPRLIAPMSPIPGNTNIHVNDPSVTIYNLDTIQIGEVDAMPLPGLPDLQPPVSLQADYPSPFKQADKSKK